VNTLAAKKAPYPESVNQAENKVEKALAPSLIYVDVCFAGNWQKLSINQFGSFKVTLRNIRHAFKSSIPRLRKRDEFKVELVGGGGIERNQVIQEGDKLMIKLTQPRMKSKNDQSTVVEGSRQRFYGNG
jgi:hypothetical protein